MCLILFAHETHPEYRLVLAANRDEFYDRPTHPAGRWRDAPQVIAGRDLRGGGTWLGVTETGRWAALTNVRDAAEFGRTAPSRGKLVAEYLRGSEPPEAYASRVTDGMEAFNGFNLLVGDAGSVWWLSNRAPELAGPVEPGIHGVSNALLDTPWPKVTRGTAELERLVSGAGTLGSDRLLGLLLDRTAAADHELPDTGVSREMERALSSPFIASPGYGTRSSTGLLIHASGTIQLVERTHHPITGDDAPPAAAPTPPTRGPAPTADRWSEVRHEIRVRG